MLEWTNVQKGERKYGVFDRCDRRCSQWRDGSRDLPVVLVSYMIYKWFSAADHLV